jgi:hypothetical protein
MGHRLWRRGPRRRDPRSPAAPQSHLDDSRRKLSAEAQEEGRLFCTGHSAQSTGGARRCLSAPSANSRLGGCYSMGRMEVVTPAASYAVISRRAGRNIKNRVWKLPQVWKHRTLPHLLGKPTERVSHSSHTPFLLAVNQRGSVLVSSGGQKILSLDNCLNRGVHPTKLCPRMCPNAVRSRSKRTPRQPDLNAETGLKSSISGLI